MMMRLLLTLALLCSSTVGWAQNTTILNGESGLSVRGKLNGMLAHQYDVEQPPYSTAGSQYLQIQNAINDACATGAGGIVLLGVNNYNIGNNTINFQACINPANPGFKPGIWLQGNGLNQGFGRTTITCSTIGFCVDKHAVDRASGAQFSMGLAVLDGMAINNTLTDSRGLNDVGAGALRFEGLTAGLHVSNCQVSGGVGIVAFQGSFSGDISHCQFNGGGGYPGSVGLYAGQITVTDWRSVGCGICISAAGGTTMTNISTESSSYGIMVGLSQPNTFSAFIDNGTGGGSWNNTSGKVMTVTKYAYGPFDNDDGSGAGGHGRGIAPYGFAAGAPATWTSPNGGTLTFTTAFGTPPNGASPCTTTGFVGATIPTGYNFTNVNCQWPGGTTIQIRGVDNPGPPISGSIPNPGTNTVWNLGQGLLFSPGATAIYPDGTIGNCISCTAGLTVVAQITSTQAGGATGAEGTYAVNLASNSSLQTFQTGQGGYNSTGVSLRGWQTEHLNIGLYIASSTAATFSNMLVSGTYGSDITTTAAQWTAPNNGTLTFTLAWDSGRNSVQTCFTSGFDSGFNFGNTANGVGVTCTWAGKTVTITGVANSITIPTPPGGINSVSLGRVSPHQDSCISFGAQIISTTVSNANCGIGSPQDLDFSGFDTASSGWLVLDNVSIAHGITLPPTGSRAFVVVRNSLGVGPADFQVPFSSLPGQGGIGLPAAEGQEILIVDAQSANCSVANCPVGSNVTGGGGALHRRVRWNGANWTVTAQ